ncbi:MAG: hypothetical protein HY329_24525 [Chloroflexi bacterium]|nr:hypothetical protein [Chloroflexota bacterium]
MKDHQLSGVLTLGVLVGGTGAPLRPLVDELPVDRVAVFDMPVPLDEARPPVASDRVVEFEIVRGLTTPMLCDQLAQLRPDLAPLAAKLRSVQADLHAGAGQLRALGFAAVQHWIATGGDRRFRDEIVRPLMKAQSAQEGIRGVDLVIVASASGGTGSGAAIPLADLASREFAHILNVPVRVTFVLVASEAHLAVGAHVLDNGATCLNELLGYVRALPEAAEITRSALVVTLPPDGADASRRERHVQASLPALLGGATRAALDLTRE